MFLRKFFDRNRNSLILVMKHMIICAYERYTKIKNWVKIEFQNQMQEDTGYVCNCPE